MDGSSHALLRKVADELEADISEIVRRAIQAYQFGEPCDVGDHRRRAGLERGKGQFGDDESRIIHVRIPPKTKAILDEEKEESGDSYTFIVTQALRLFTQIVRNRKEKPNGMTSIVPEYGHSF